MVASLPVALVWPGDPIDSTSSRLTVSVVIPVYNAAPLLERCLAAVARSQGVSFECVVVDDCSDDDSGAVADRWGARVFHTGHPRSGPAVARNVGAAAASNPLLCFLDADVLVRPDTLAQFVEVFERDPELGAAFGSYDATPEAPGLVSQYRNLLHHYVHQTGRTEARTFWAGCGVMRSTWFGALGGFDTSYGRPSIEDVELGYRLRAAGGRIRLAKHITVTHLKVWTLRNMLVTDIRDRALPWTALIARTRTMPDDLNLNLASRLSSVCALMLLVLIPLGCVKRGAWQIAALPLALLIAFNRGLYALFLDRHGPRFACCAVGLHWLYFVSGAAAFAVGSAKARLCPRSFAAR